MKVKMIETTQGSENGYQLNNYMKDEVYDISDEVLAKHFVSTGVASEVSDSTEPTKVIVEGTQEIDRGSLAPSELAKVEADRERGIARPEMDRLVEISSDNQIDVEEQKKEAVKARKRADVERQKTELDATLNEPVDEKALKSEDYENKAKKGK